MKHVFLFVSVIYIKSINDTHTRYLYIQNRRKHCVSTNTHTEESGTHSYTTILRGRRIEKKIGKSGRLKVIFILYSREQRGAEEGFKWTTKGGAVRFTGYNFIQNFNFLRVDKHSRWEKERIQMMLNQFKISFNKKNFLYWITAVFPCTLKKPSHYRCRD